MSNAVMFPNVGTKVVDISSLKQKRRPDTSNYMADGKRKPVAGEPIRSQEDILKIRHFLLNNSKQNVALRNNMLFTVGISVGIRGNDLIRLKIRDVLDDNGEIVKELTVFESKTSKMNHPMLNEEARKSIRDYIDSLDEYDDDDYLFKAQGKNEPFKRSNFHHFMKKIEKECGLGYNLTVRSLRKTFAYWTIKLHPDNVNVLASLQEMLNHNDMKTTLHYSGHAKDHLSVMYDDMAQVFDEAKNFKEDGNANLESKIDRLLELMGASDFDDE